MKMEDLGRNFNASPMGYHNPICRHEGAETARFAILATDPDRMGGGVAFWAYSEEEADDAVVAYRNAGYHFVEKARFEDIFSE
jgi:hypothetical protein